MNNIVLDLKSFGLMFRRERKLVGLTQVQVAKNAEIVIDQIETFKEETLKDCRFMIYPWLFDHLKLVWSGSAPH